MEENPFQLNLRVSQTEGEKIQKPIGNTSDTPRNRRNMKVVGRWVGGRKGCLI